MEVTHGDAVPPSDVVGVGLAEDGSWDPAAGEIIERLGDDLGVYLSQLEISGKAGESARYPTPSLDGIDQVLVIGLGADPDAEALRRAAGQLAKETPTAARVATTLASRQVAGAGRAVVEGLLLGAYQFERYRSEPKLRVTEAVTVVGAEAAAVNEGRVVAEAVTLARDLINTPAADKAPAAVVAAAQEAMEGTSVRAVVHAGAELEERGFGGLVAVGAGSVRPPQLLELWYEPEGATAFLALVGKGITFDSGGLSLKSATGMETMKTDMSGAAAVIGAVAAIARLEIPVKILAVTPLADNMPSGSATKPGDVLTTYNGKTIEVLNTDAEGRLVLADALALAAEYHPDLIVDLATLTGACKVALGEKIAGGFGTSDDVIRRVIGAGSRAGERIWHLPLPQDYRKLIDSQLADMVNTGGRFGGAITAALLLKEFVGEADWVHLDIAGPARWPDDEHYQTKGGSGFGVRTLVALAEELGGS